MKNINKGGYSIVVAVLVVGFLLVLSSGTLNLVLSELKDTKGETDYMKSFAAAEGASELALLKIKKEGYSFKDSISETDSRSIILGDTIKDPKITYDLAYTVNSYNGNLASAGYDIIPLFYTDSSGEHKAVDISLTSSSVNITSALAWNIISNSGGIVGEGVFNKKSIGYGQKIEKELGEQKQVYVSKTVGDFLSENTNNYLMLFNVDENNPIEYNLSSENNTYFTLPRTDIISSAKVGKYKQNLQTHLDNTKFLGLLKYSLYSDSE